jgi:hypothetical protein
METDADGAPQPEEEDDLGDWYPACLTKPAVRLCVHEGCTEVLKYKRHFDVKDLAESELASQIEWERRRLSVMEVDPPSFLQDIAHTKQRIAQLEDKLAKEDASAYTTGEHHTTGGRIQLLLGNHIQAMAKEEQEHLTEMADYESQVAVLKATMALAEKTFARRVAANEALKTELETK